jgi:hypothetical protein
LLCAVVETLCDLLAVVLCVVRLVVFAEAAGAIANAAITTSPICLQNLLVNRKQHLSRRAGYITGCDRSSAGLPHSKVLART